MNWMYADAIGGIKVDVDDENFEAARTIVAEMEAGERALPEDEDGESIE